MRFTDGYWMVREGFTLLRAAEVRDVEVAAGEQGDGGGDELVVYAPTARIHDRAATLNQPLLTLRYSAPAPDVIRVRLTHHAGGVHRGPDFTVAAAEAPVAPAIALEAESATLTSGSLTVRVSRGAPYRVDFLAGGRALTGSMPRGTGIALDPDGTPYAFDQLRLGVGEAVYGLGERFGPLVKNGQSVDLWNADGGTSSEQAYKNVPFWWSNAGYGVFVAHPERVGLEIGSEAVSATQFSVPGRELDYYVIHGPTPAEILEKYTRLTGRAPRVPAWSYGLWLSTSFTTSYDEATVTSFVDGMASRGIPLSVVHFDCFWMREFHWCDFVWDPATFPDPEGMLARLHERRLKVCVWINPYIAQRSALFAEGAEKGYLVPRPDGSVWQWDLWQAGMGLVDFTNPAAADWYAGHLDRLLDQGVDCFKTDFGERIPTDVVWHDGSDPERMHNYYTHLYNKTVFDLLRRRRGEGEAVLFARSATAGGQQFPVHWGGDCDSTFASMAETLRGGLSLAASGFGYWSHDIGGFEGTPDPAVYKRWVAFGLLSSHSRLHGSTSYRVPWAFDEEAVEVTRRFSRLKLSLLPYLTLAERVVTERGLPMMRPMPVAFPDDPAVTHLDRQYLLGDSLLVAPVLDAEGGVDYYLPEGRWVRLLDGGVVEGGGWRRERHGFDSLPVLVRPGSVVPVGARVDAVADDLADGVTLAVVGLVDGDRRDLALPGAAGAVSFTVSRSGDRYVATRAPAGASGSWRLQVVLDPAATIPEVVVGEGALVADRGERVDGLAGPCAETDGDRIELEIRGDR